MKKKKKITIHSSCLPAVFALQYCHLQLTECCSLLHLCQPSEVIEGRALDIGSSLHSRWNKVSKEVRRQYEVESHTQKQLK